jgi:hypothetical protein
MLDTSALRVAKEGDAARVNQCNRLVLLGVEPSKDIIDIEVAVDLR